MTFKLPPLPYAMDALNPHLSTETVEYHYGKHHQTYVDKLNALIENTDFAKKSLEEIIKTSDGAIFNNAAQVWNHTFYWNCLSPKGGETPNGKLLIEIKNEFESFENFKQKFSSVAVGQFGSGWVWLVKKQDGKLSIISTSNAGNPLTTGCKPLLTCDVWEHAYYIDFRNARPKYIDAFWKMVNWDFVSEQL